MNIRPIYSPRWVTDVATRYKYDPTLMALTIKSLLSEAARTLGHLPSGQLDAEVLLCTVLGADRAKLYAWPERMVAEGPGLRFQRLVSHRAEGWPLAYLTGFREFWSLQLEVTADTLIPRVETEHLVEAAVRHVPVDRSFEIAELGTGSGAIALAIAAERPYAQIVASDISEQALTVAERNALRLGITRVRFRQGDWCDALNDEAYDLIVSNPPYIRDDDPHLANGDVRFEPGCALRGGSDGLAAAHAIIHQAPDHLKPGGWLLLEHGFDQGPSIRKRFGQNRFNCIHTYFDYSGHERVTEGQRADS